MRTSRALPILLGLLAAACSREARTVGPDLPQTPPNGRADPRAAKYEQNAYQISQGGRYFTWYGCGACHASDAKGVLNLGDEYWKHGGSLTDVYATIAHGHPGALAHLGDRIPTEQLWQITAYARTLHTLNPDQRRRQDLDQAGEPQGDNWSGPLQ